MQRDGPEPATHTTRTICRTCHANCSLIVEMAGGEPVRFYGDKNNPISHGFSCVKGRNMLQHHRSPTRLVRSVKRVGDRVEPIASAQAMTEIGRRLKELVERHGPRSVAIFAGTFGALNTLSWYFQQFFMEAIGSPMLFTSATIDQPGKNIGEALHGAWEAGWRRNPEELDVVLLVGHNPIISLGGAFGSAPAANIMRARRKGTKLIVCDPRRTETAQHADIFLQPRPGTDAAILAGMIRIILTEERHDADFVAEHANGLERLRAAVAPFTPDMVAATAGIDATDLVAAARMLAAGRRGLIECGTGPNMSPHRNLTEYLGRVLTTLCGHWPREGERIPNPGVLFHPRGPRTAATAGPQPAWGFGEPLRVHGLTNTAAGMPTPALADEITTPGEGKVRALIVVGGNPMLAWPDQRKTYRALKQLDLLVCLDPVLSATARLADYVIAPTLPLEVPALSSCNEMLGTFGLIWGYDLPYAQYTPALVDRPAGSDLIDEWKFFVGVAREMGVPLKIRPVCFTDPQEAERRARFVDVDRHYTTDDILDLLFEGSPVPIDRVRREAQAGKVFDVPEARVLPRPAEHATRFELADATMLEELGTIAATRCEDTAYPFRLISRRMRDHYNTNWREIDVLKREYAYNPAFMNPADADRLGLREHDLVSIASDTDRIVGIVRLEAALRPGCVSMSHGWGVNPGERDDPATTGASTSRLISTDRDCDPHTWMARQSAIPVRVSAFDMAGG